eukprot:GHVT01033119.1.p3 GENE.GHVT01033119.1~~GHVT01033119.1.p3  ORF type:complete len:111 (+),score=10.55 GHVT01033119.1:2007-2339(+)
MFVSRIRDKASAALNNPHAIVHFCAFSVVQFQIKLIAPPQYVAVTSCLAKERGVQAVEAAIQAIRDSIRSFKGGDFKQQGEIAVMGGEEEKRLEELFEGVCLCDKGLCDS